MKNYRIPIKLFTGLLFLHVISASGQLTASGVQLWENYLGRESGSVKLSPY